MDRSRMRERRNLIRARWMKNKYFRWILNFCPLNFSKFQKKRLLFLLQLLNKSKTIKATKTKSNDSTVLINTILKKSKKLHFLVSELSVFLWKTRSSKGSSPTSHNSTQYWPPWTPKLPCPSSYDKFTLPGFCAFTFVQFRQLFRPFSPFKVA